MLNGLNVRRGKTADPDSEQPKRIKEKVGRCDCITTKTHLPYEWHHQSRIRAWGGGINVGGWRRGIQRRQELNRRKGNAEWSSWGKLKAQDEDYLLSKKQHGIWLPEESEKMRAGICCVMTLTLWTFFLFAGGHNFSLSLHSQHQ